nr:MAG TPA: hypothetical protein [Caudoviricetes sp.]
MNNFYLLLQNLNDQRILRLTSEYLESNNLHLLTLSHLWDSEL